MELFINTMKKMAKKIIIKKKEIEDTFIIIKGLCEDVAEQRQVYTYIKVDDEIINLILMYKQYTKIKFEPNIIHPIDFAKLEHITELEISNCKKCPINLDKLHNLTKLYINIEDDFENTINNITKIENLEDLILNISAFVDINDNYVLDLTMLTKLKKLELKNYNKSIDNLPMSLEELKLDTNVNLDNLPNNVKILNLKDCYSFEYSLNLLPDSIEELYLPNFYFQKINKIPKNLKLIKYFSTKSNYYKMTLQKAEFKKQPISQEELHKLYESLDNKDINIINYDYDDY